MTDRPLTVVLIDDHSTTHRLVAEVLALASDIHLVGQGATGNDALPLYEEHQPDVVLMDVMMPGMDGPTATRAVLAKYPQARILVLSGFQDDDSVRAMLVSGAVGYVLKVSLLQDLVNGIRAAATGAMLLSPSVARTVVSRPTSTHNTFGLTERELEVLRLLASGLGNKQVADVLTISISTVKYHLGNILEKMGVSTRSEAIVLAAKEDML